MAFNWNKTKSAAEAGFDESKGNHKAFCPACQETRSADKRKSDRPVIVQAQKGFAFCNHCSEGWFWNDEGSHREYHVKREKTYKKPMHKVPEVIEQSDKQKLADWLIKHRGFPADRVEAVIDHFGLHLTTIGGYPKIAFPFYQDGELVYCKFKDFKADGTGNWMADKGEGDGNDTCMPTAFGHDQIDPSKPLIIWTEGEFDAMAVWIALGDVANVCSVPNGAPNVGSKADSKIDFLDRSNAYKDQAHFLAFDNDPNGRYLQKVFLDKVGREHCQLIPLEKFGVKDANELLKSQGVEALIQALESHVNAPIEGLVHVEDEIDKIMGSFGQVPAKGVSTGFKSLDDTFRLVQGQMTTLTGIPAVGKSALTDAIAINTAKSDGWRWIVWTPESGGNDTYIRRLVERMTGKLWPTGQGWGHVWRRIGREPEQHHILTQSEAREALEFISQHFDILCPDDTSMDSIIKLVKSACARNVCHGLVIDPFTELDPSEAEIGLTDRMIVKGQIAKIRRLAEECNLATIVVAHPTKQLKDNKGQYGWVDGYGIAESANFANKSYQVVSLWRHMFETRTSDLPAELQEVAENVLVRTFKCKTTEGGQAGTSAVRYDPVADRYVDWSGTYVRRIPRKIDDLNPKNFFDEEYEKPITGVARFKQSPHEAKRVANGESFGGEFL